MGLKAIAHVERAVHAIALHLAERKDLKVNQAEAHVLAHLHGARLARVGELHAEFGHRRSTLTSILERLEQRGLLTRSTARDDRRGVTVRLTASGSVLAARVYAALSAYESSALEGITARELAAARRLLEALSRG